MWRRKASFYSFLTLPPPFFFSLAIVTLPPSLDNSRLTWYFSANLHIGITLYCQLTLVCAHFSQIAVGLVQETAPINILVGWRDSWGYHSDDGSLLTGNRKVSRGPAYSAGQVVGVAYNPGMKRLRLTLNREEAGKSRLVQSC